MMMMMMMVIMIMMMMMMMIGAMDPLLPTTAVLMPTTTKKVSEHQTSIQTTTEILYSYKMHYASTSCDRLTCDILLSTLISFS